MKGYVSKLYCCIDGKVKQIAEGLNYHCNKITKLIFEL